MNVIAELLGGSWLALTFQVSHNVSSVRGLTTYNDNLFYLTQ